MDVNMWMQWVWITKCNMWWALYSKSTYGKKTNKPLISWEPQIYKTVYKMIVAVKNISWSEMEHKENQGVYFIWDQAAIRDMLAREDFIQALKTDQ